MELCKFVRDHAHRALYYPACGEDWEPLCQLSHYCDVFVYCDTLRPHRKIVKGKSVGVVRRDSAWLENQFGEIHKKTSAGDRLHVQEVTELEFYQSSENFKLKPLGSWSKLVTLTLKENGVIRPLKLFYIKGHGEVLYRTLYYNKSIAPRIICLRHPRRTDFMLRTCIFAKLVMSGACKPEFIVTHYPLQEDCDWGWNQVVQREFDGWDNEEDCRRKIANNKNPMMREEPHRWGRVSLLARPS